MMKRSQPIPTNNCANFHFTKSSCLLTVGLVDFSVKWTRHWVASGNFTTAKLVPMSREWVWFFWAIFGNSRRLRPRLEYEWMKWMPSTHVHVSEVPRSPLTAGSFFPCQAARPVFWFASLSSRPSYTTCYLISRGKDNSRNTWILSCHQTPALPRLGVIEPEDKGRQK